MFESTLPDNAQNALALLGKNKILPAQTYLAGGTSLALQIGHRISVDFDFFTPTTFNQEILSQGLSEIGKFESKNQAPNTLLGKFENISFSIFTYKYPLISELSIWNKINLAGLKDIGAMKIAAIMDRGTKKDFIDLYFLNNQGLSIDALLDMYDQKYQLLDNHLYSIIKSFGYFEQAEESEMPPMLKDVSWEEIKKFFEHESLRLARKFI